MDDPFWNQSINAHANQKDRIQTFLATEPVDVTGEPGEPTSEPVEN